MLRLVFALVGSLLALPASAQPADFERMVEVQGGGFIFNYRLGQAFYGILLKPLRDLPRHTVIEVSFEDPAGGAAIVQAEAFDGSPRALSFQTPPLHGIEAHRPYTVEIALRDPATNAVIAQAGRQFASDVGQDVLPERPLTIGPGYHPNPEAR